VEDISVTINTQNFLQKAKYHADSSLEAVTISWKKKGLVTHVKQSSVRSTRLVVTKGAHSKHPVISTVRSIAEMYIETKKRRKAYDIAILPEGALQYVKKVIQDVIHVEESLI
jgi:hypothetical protein